MRFLLLAPLALILPAPLAAQAAPEPTWAFEESDIPVDPDYRFGQLENGMRYVVRANGTPEGTAVVRLRIGSGSLAETDEERGLAHFLEHMAFNGSARVPEGEMTKLLEREGLAFGADTNASTGYRATTYKLDLPRTDPDLLDLALMLMRETASELTIAQDAVERERGVILAERRDRRTFALTEVEDRIAFMTPDARYGERLPVGTLEVLESANAARLRAFYEREYVPANAVLVVVGDFDAAMVEAAIREKFADWSAAPMPAEPVTGPVDVARAGFTDIYTDPALNERISVMAFRPWEDRPDSVATRQENLLRTIGYGIVNRRLQSVARSEAAPFRSAGFATADIFEDARVTSLLVDTPDGEWREGLEAAVAVVRRALANGFTQAEVDEQVARIRTAQENAAAGAYTRSNGALAGAALALVEDEQVPSTPASSLARFEAFAPQITPEATYAAMLADAAPLDDPLIRFVGREEPEGGGEALRAAWDAATAAPIAADEAGEATEFAYTDFGPPGTVVDDRVDDRFGLRLVRFANGLRLNLKQTDIQRDRVAYRLSVDGGTLLATRDDPLKTAMVGVLPLGGLGAHTQDELVSILAGRSVGFGIGADIDALEMSGTTTPRDLELQLQVLAAAITDPGYRSQGETRYRRNIANFFLSRTATPGSTLSSELGGILSDGDPRFTLQDKVDYDALDFAKLRADIGDRLAQGALELALVGDFDPGAAIRYVAQTLGALPAREAEFQPRAEARQRSFTADRSTRVLYHDGEADQALLRYIWPTTDDSDQREAVTLAVLGQVLRLELLDELRERLGQAYSAIANSSASRYYPDYGTFALGAQVDVGQVDAVRAAIREVVERTRTGGIDEDLLQRARQPLAERYDNALKTLGGWRAVADRAQSEAERLDRFLAYPDVLASITPDAIRDAARRYLAPDEAVEVAVLPRPADGS